MGSRKRQEGLRSDQVRSILKEAFKTFRNIDLSDQKLKEVENKVFINSYMISARNAAKAMLAVMDESFNDTKFFAISA